MSKKENAGAERTTGEGTNGAGRTPDEDKKLKGLAAAIREGHRKCTNAMKGVVEQARDTGKALADAKGLVGHGGWTTWVKNNCKFAMRMAQNYMLVATHYDAVVARCAGADAWRLTEFLKVAQRLEWERRGKTSGGGRAAGKPDPFALPPDEIGRRRERLRAAGGADRVATGEAVSAFLRQKLDALYAAVRQFAASKGVKGVAGDGLDAADVGILLIESLKAGLDPSGLVVPAPEAPPPATAAPATSDRPDAPAAPKRHEANGRHAEPLLV